ncbi:MAG: Holliday junction branch migration protein RuvA [Proteobacteria bacterium]|nr:Holliday junction branch migration protein RuvA [Pseudomonadota bacterium]
MIVKLTGILDEKTSSSIVLDVHGVGYGILISEKTYIALSSVKERVTLLICHIIRQDDQLLCGFLTQIEKQWFELLITVQGVGIKVALSILSKLTADEMAAFILKQTPKPFTEADGVGPKVANRIVLELKNKIPTDTSLSDRLDSQIKVNHILNQNTLVQDAISALCNLGYQKNEVTAAVQKIVKSNPSIQTGDLVRLSLQQMAKYTS